MTSYGPSRVPALIFMGGVSIAWDVGRGRWDVGARLAVDGETLTGRLPARQRPASPIGDAQNVARGVSPWIHGSRLNSKPREGRQDQEAF